MSKVETALRSTNLKFAHFGWASKPSGDYGIWEEWGTHEVHGCGKVLESAISGSIHYFTRTDNSTAKDTIEAALNSIQGGFGWTLNTIQYENDTHYIHYEWLYEEI